MRARFAGDCCEVETLVDGIEVADKYWRDERGPPVTPKVFCAPLYRSLSMYRARAPRPAGDLPSSEQKEGQGKGAGHGTIISPQLYTQRACGFMII